MEACGKAEAFNSQAANNHKALNTNTIDIYFNCWYDMYSATW